MRTFTPHPRWTGGHWMTLYAWGSPRHFPTLPAAVPRYFDVAPRSLVLAHCHWQRDPWRHPTLIALHGLESSSDAHYVRGLSAKAFGAGFNAVWATWGYSSPEHQRTAASQSLPSVSLDNFLTRLEGPT